jgi:hypothetical protein
MEFSSIVEEVKSLPYELKQELRFLLEKYLIEERRTEIYKNYKKAQKEYKKNRLAFSDNIDDLKQMLS